MGTRGRKREWRLGGGEELGKKGVRRERRRKKGIGREES
jgi:hypothetical protein